jgi:mRNA interferase MazF
MKVSQGDVDIVDFPYSDRTGTKVRPALVVQADQWNVTLDDTILALITSSQRRRVGAATQFPVTLASSVGRQSGLRMDSVVQCDNLITVNQNLILRKLGSFDTASMDGIGDCLQSTFGIPTTLN